MMQRVAMIGSALSQLINVMTARDLKETGPNESVSARMHRQRRKGERIINAVFFWQHDPGHCERAFQSDVTDAVALLAEVEMRGVDMTAKRAKVRATAAAGLVRVVEGGE